MLGDFTSPPRASDILWCMISLGMVNGSFISHQRICKKRIKFKIQERKLTIFSREKKISISLWVRILYLNINCVSFAFPCWNLPVSAEWWEKLFSKDWENNQESQSAAFLLWFLGKMDYKNIVMQGKNSLRPQHCGCGPGLVLELKMVGTRRAESCLWEGQGGKAEHPSAMCPALPALSAALQKARGGVHVSYWIPQWEGLRKESEWETFWTQHNRTWEGIQTKPGLIAVRLGLCAKQNLLCPLIPLLTREEQNSTCLCHLWELKSTWGSRQGEGSPMAHVPCPGIFQDQEKDKCYCKWDWLITISSL